VKGAGAGGRGRGMGGAQRGFQYRVIGWHDSIRRNWLSSTQCIFFCMSDIKKDTLKVCVGLTPSSSAEHTHTHTHTRTHARMHTQGS